MKIVKPLIIILLGIILMLNALLLPFQSLAFNEDYYITAFTALKVHETIGIDEAALTRVTRALIQHIDDGSGDITLVENVKGENVVFYNEKEQHHLHDIYFLVKGGRTFLIIIDLLMLLLLILLYLYSKREKLAFVKEMTKVFKSAVFATLFVLVALGALYFVDFDWAFRRFHEIFFTNDLWLLDPRTDRLIQLMPFEFFTGFTADWLLRVGFINLVFILIGFVLPLLKNRKRTS